MSSNIHIRNSDQSCRIEIEGVIGIPESQQFDDPSTRIATWEKFSRTVERIRDIRAPEIVVEIRSTGGDVNDALLIYEALRATGSRITTRCYGYTASAATVIAQAASEGAREIASSALYLIHCSMCAAEGNADELASQLDLLRQTDDRLAELYATRSGGTKEGYLALMQENRGRGRWLSPAQAVEAGLADRILETPAAEAAVEARSDRAGVWNALLRRIGLLRRQDEPLPEDLNILHAEQEAQQPTPPDPERLAASDPREAVSPTRTLPKEDPAVCETVRTANEMAYARDARRFTRI